MQQVDDPGNIPAVPSGFSFFRAGEVLAVFEVISASGSSGMSPVELREAFGALGVEIHEQPFFDSDLNGDREPVEIAADGGRRFIVQSINLASWRPDLELLQLRGNSAQLDRAVEDVPRAVAALSTRIDAQTHDPFVVGNLRLDSVGPNWRVAPAVWLDAGGPAGQPIIGGQRYFRPARSTLYNGDPQFVRAEYIRLLGRSPTNPDLPASGVRVAILDTWPVDDAGDSTGKIATFLSANGINYELQHPLLYNAGAGLLINEFYDLQPSTTLPHVRVNWSTRSVEPQYDMSDHGLFVAGIIRDIAPRAHISVYRVLNDNGGGAHFLSIYQALAHAIAQAQNAEQPLIVNMSLALGAPIRTITALLRYPLQYSTVNNYIALVEATSNTGPARDDVIHLHIDGLVDLDPNFRVTRWKGPLAQIHQLYRQLLPSNVLLISAAGNDSDRPRLLFAPRLPAAFDGVLGVAATDAAGQYASFSNRDGLDDDHTDGLSAFGGNALHSSGAGLMHTTNGLTGLSVTPYLPPYSNGLATAIPNNTLGWAVWSGTSFATPIVAGMAACIWGDNGGWGRDQVLNGAKPPAPDYAMTLTQY